MKKKKESPKGKEEKLTLMRRRSYNWPKENMKYCIENGLTIYPSCQSDGKVIIFAQQGERFKPVNDKKYSQNTEEEILEYTMVIIDSYDEYAEKIRLKKEKNVGK